MTKRKWRSLIAVLTLLMMTSCSGNAESTPTPGLPGAQMAFTVMSSGGMAPAVYQADDWERSWRRFGFGIETFALMPQDADIRVPAN